MKKAKDLRDQSLEELETSYNESCEMLYRLNNQARVEKKREKPHETRLIRKDIARLLTVMTEKKKQIR